MHYPKIETLYDRDEKFKVMPLSWRTYIFDFMQDCKWLWTEKIDGTNICVSWDRGTLRFTLGGRTDKAQIPARLVAKLQVLFDDSESKRMLTTFPKEDIVNVTIFGEGFGAMIQNGAQYLPDSVDFIVFDVLVNERWWLSFADVQEIAAKLGLRCVPIVGIGNLKEVTELLKLGFTSSIANCPAEGVVVRPPVPLFDNKGDRVIGKLKTKDF